MKSELEFKNHQLLSTQQIERLSWGCALAIASTVAATAGAAFITGGAALIIFLIGKGLAAAGLIGACT